MTIRKSRVDWEQDIEKWQASGKSIASFCKETGIPYGTFRSWRNKVQVPRSEQKLIEITLNNQKKSEYPDKFVLNLPSGISLCLPVETSPHYLATLIRELIR